MTAQTTLPVLICGAGPAGLALAVELARRGVSLRIVDRRAGAFHGSRGKGIQPRTLEVFDDLGIVDRIVAAGGPYPRQRVYQAHGTHDEEGVTRQAPTAAEPYGEPWMVVQFRTEAILRDRLAAFGVSVEWATDVVAFEQDDIVRTQVTSSAGAESIASSYLVGADGGRSIVRQRLGIDFPGKTLGVRAMVADLDLRGLDCDAWHRFNDGDMARQLSLCPLMGTDLIQLQAPVPPEGEVETSLDAVQRLVTERTGRADLRVDAVAWVSVYTMNARLATRYRSGRALLVGDAAHIHPPTGGQGLNTSIQDAYNLGWKLAAVLAGAPDTLLDTYEEERRPVAEDMLGLSTRLLEATSRGDMRRGRDAQQLDLGYASSLCLEDPPRDDGVRAGDRAPDARVSTADGHSLRLFELFRGTHWTVLCFESEHAPSPRRDLRVHRIAPHGNLGDTQATFRTAYQAKPDDWFVVRPDGYIGAILGRSAHDGLDAYLRSAGFDPS